MVKARTIAFSICLLLAATTLAAKDRGPQPVDLTAQFRGAGVTMSNFEALELGGIVLLRGLAPDHATAEDAGRIAQTLGYARVANLVQVATPVDDKAIERNAERELAVQRSLDGCQFSVQSQNGVVKVAGLVHEELQKDMAVQLIRNIDGVKEVHAELLRR